MSGGEMCGSIPVDLQKEFFDVYILYAREDHAKISSFRNALHQINLSPGNNVSTCTVDDIDWIIGLPAAFEEAVDHSTFIFMMLSKNFEADRWAKLQASESVMRILSDKKDCLVPVPIEQDAFWPPCTKSLKALELFNGIETYRPILHKMLGRREACKLDKIKKQKEKQKAYFQSLQESNSHASNGQKNTTNNDNEASGDLLLTDDEKQAQGNQLENLDDDQDQGNLDDDQDQTCVKELYVNEPVQQQMSTEPQPDSLDAYRGVPETDGNDQFEETCPSLSSIIVKEEAQCDSLCQQDGDSKLFEKDVNAVQPVDCTLLYNSSKSRSDICYTSTQASKSVSDNFGKPKLRHSQSVPVLPTNPQFRKFRSVSMSKQLSNTGLNSLLLPVSNPGIVSKTSPKGSQCFKFRGIKASFPSEKSLKIVQTSP